MMKDSIIKKLTCFLKGNRISIFLFGLMALLCVSTSGLAVNNTNNATPSNIRHPQLPFPASLQAFIDYMVSAHGFNKQQLQTLFLQANIIPPVVSHVKKPMELQTWDVYRTYFLTPKRILGGARYWQQHRNTLAAAEHRYGVDPSVIVAIIGVESLYGVAQANYQTLGALTTLAFYNKVRSGFFEKELEHYLLLTREFGLPAASIRGSYAGALGIPQFMPSSYRRFAVSYTNSKHIDLLNNHDDAIMSIAHYLYLSGWRPNQPVALPAVIKQSNSKMFISKSAYPNYTLATLNKYGIYSPQQLPNQQKVGLITMHNRHNDEYWLIFPNFSAIMSYNPRTTYSLAVYQLSQAIKRQYEQQEAVTKAS